MLQKIVIEEVKSEDTELMEIKVNSDGNVTNEFIFHSMIALISAFENRRNCKKQSIIQALSKAIEESDEGKESGEPINEVE